MDKESGSKKRCTAILLAGGQGTRMGTRIQKQYLLLQDRPVLFYSLHTFERSEVIDDVILVTGAEQTEYARKEFVEKYHFTKVTRIVEGGRERYHSVWEGLKAAEAEGGLQDRYIFIHDSARPFVTEEIIRRAYCDVRKYHACVVGVPSKDTVKLVDEKTFSRETPDRRFVWIIQTPQVFDASIITEAYAKMMSRDMIRATDDAMAVENELHIPVHMTEGSYENIKITTPEDLDIAKVFVKKCFPDLCRKIQKTAAKNLNDCIDACFPV